MQNISITEQEKRVKHAAEMRAWAAANPEKKRENDRKYRERHREEVNAYWREYHKTHREQRRETQRRYRASHPGESQKIQRRYRAEVKSKDAGFVLCRRLAQRVRNVVRSRGVIKADCTLALTGCTVAALLEHLEGHFQQGMSWQNFGFWHIDHIRPCASFDLRDPAQQRACFHYTNLQPLWAADNRAKGAKILEGV